MLVVPEAGIDPHYANVFAAPADRYEDYIVHDLISDVERKFPAARGTRRAIVGASLGGVGAVRLALSNPSVFVFAGGISSTIDDATRPSSPGGEAPPRALWTSRNGERRRSNDPFFLAGSVDPNRVPYIFLMCGDRERNWNANVNFVKLLTQCHIPHEFRAVAGGGHNWTRYCQS